MVNNKEKGFTMARKDQQLFNSDIVTEEQAIARYNRQFGNKE